MSKSAKASLPTCLCREPKKEAGGATVTSTFFKYFEAGYIKIQLHLLFHLPISSHPDDTVPPPQLCQTDTHRSCLRERSQKIYSFVSVDDHTGKKPNILAAEFLD